MTSVSATLITDGSSDVVLIEAIQWMVASRPLRLTINYADFRPLRSPPRSMDERMKTAISMYPCDFLIVHRDAERESYEARRAEIEREATTSATRIVPVVPVRMSEAWLLFDEQAIRRAAGNPNGRTPLSLPVVSNVELVPDPKDVLHKALVDASELRGRRRDSFNVHKAVHAVARLIETFEPIENLPAFSATRTEILHAIDALA